MALHVFYDSDITALANKLKELLLEHKPTSPFEFRKIAVPNGVMEKWLRTRVFAETPELTAGIEFPFMDKFLTEKLCAFLNVPGIELLPNNAYTYGIMTTLCNMDKANDAFKPFYKYIFDKEEPGDVSDMQTARKAWQLSKCLADLLDTYEVHRPDLIEAWLGNEDFTGSYDKNIAGAEKALTHAIFNPDGIYPENGQKLSLRQLFNRAKNSGKTTASEKRGILFFFGYSSLSPLHANILYFLSKHYEIYYFFFDVCVEYWGDITPNRKLSENPNENALLSSWGSAGRETINLLMKLEETYDEDFQCEVNGLDYRELHTTAKSSVSEGETVLKKIQNSIRNRTNTVKKTNADASLQIIGASGLRREVEMVHNSILASVNETSDFKDCRPWTKCKFSDIAVLVPDLPTYLPYIDYVFNSRGNVPYNIIDMTADQTSQYLSAFKALIALHQKGITRDTLFNFLEMKLVANALHYSLDEVENWRKIAENFGAFDYFDEQDMNAHNRANAASFTWGWALKRLRRTTITDKYTVQDGNIELALDTMNVGASELKFSEIVELLYRKLKTNLDKKEFQDSKSWNKAFSDLMNTFLEPDNDDLLEISVRAQIFRVLNALENLNMPPHAYDFEVEAINMFVSALPCSKGNIFGGVTIGQLQPMRPIPYKQVYVLGLGEGKFPGTVSNSTLDLQTVEINNKKVKGTTGPEVKRYTFLETLMATGERLVLSYQERDICEDAELFPSSVIRTLKDFVDNNILTKPLDTIHLPLLERDVACLNAKMDKSDCKTGLLNTFAKDAYSIAKQKYDNVQKTAETENNVQTPAETGHETSQTTGEIDDTDYFKKAQDIGVKVLAEFLKDPLHAVLQYSFGIAKAQYRNHVLDPNTPLEMDNLVKWDIQRILVENDEQDAMEIIRKKQLEGKLPEGFLGQYAAKDIVSLTQENKDRLIQLQQYYKDFLKPTAKDGIRDIVFGNGDDKFPPRRCLNFFLSALMTIALKDNNEKTKVLCAVLSADSSEVFIYEWEDISQEVAREYLASVAKHYLNFFKTEKDNEQVVTLRYEDFIGILKKIDKIKKDQEKKLPEQQVNVDSDECWYSQLQKVIDEYEQKEKPDYKQLVIENNIEQYRNWPENGETIKNVFGKMFAYPAIAKMKKITLGN